MQPFTIITNLGDGRSLVTAPDGKERFLEDASGMKTPVTREEAAQLLREAKDAAAAEEQATSRKGKGGDKAKERAKADGKLRLKAKAQSKATAKAKAPRPLPLSRAEIEAAAAYLITHDRKDQARFGAMALEFPAKVQIKADEIEEYLHLVCDRRDRRDRTPELWIDLYQSAARKFREGTD